MYCNILKCEGDEAYAIAYIDNSIGAYFPLFDNEATEVQQVYDTGEVLLSSTVSETGSYIYVKAPIYDNDGKVIGVVEVGTLSDVLDSSVNQMIRSIAIPLIMIILVILFVFSEIFSFFDLRSKYQEEVQKTAGYSFTCCAFIGVYHLYCIQHGHLLPACIHIEVCGHRHRHSKRTSRLYPYVD